ncbi:MAG: TIR-NBS-LRR class disease resistance protein [Flavobacterium sp.]|nr:MAG: TIR-NBS-LRR class disease resistance protein [Flavobacterium sp.]
MMFKRLILLITLFIGVLIVLNSQNANAQSDLELYEKYVERNDKSLTFVDRYEANYADRDYETISLQESAYQTLYELIKERRQADVRNVYFYATDTTDIIKVFRLLKQFPNITFFNFHYYDDHDRQYEFPHEFLEFKKLKYLTVYGAKNLKSTDLLSQIKGIPTLRGVDLLDYQNDLPEDATLPDQLTLVKLSTPQLQKLDTKDAAWRYARIQQRGSDDPKDERLLQKLADIKSLEILDCQFCYIKDGSSFEGFKALRKLTIYPLLSPEVKFVKSLSALTQLKELAIYSISDTGQSFKDLEKLKYLESLDLRWLTRFQNHPEELEGIGSLTNLRSLSIQSCSLIFCPDFFKTLKALQTLTFKWNVINHSEKSSFAFPESLYQLPELQELTIWRTLSEIPSLKNLSKLQVLNLVDNDLKALPEGLADLKYLTSLTLSSNSQLSNIDYTWEKLQSLETLDLSKNNIKRYPEGLQRLSNLKNLNMANNKFSKMPPLQKETYRLKLLLLDGNLLDNLPENISSYRSLEVLSANYCGLNSLPVDFGLLSNLRVLNLERNHLKILPKEIGENQGLATINLKGNSNIDEQSLNEVIFMKPRKKFLWANLENTGIKSLPADAPWDKLKLVLDLKFNQLRNLPVEMTKMEWFKIDLENNPFPIDTGFIEIGIRNGADARIFFSELGYKKDYLKITNREMATSMSKAINRLTFYKNFENAVSYARKAKVLDPLAYQKNIDKQSLGIAFYKTKNYKEAIAMLEYERKFNNRFTSNTRMAKASEEALANSYFILGEKRKSAETHAYFARRRDGNLESSLSAAIGFLELKDLASSKKHFEDALALSKADFLRYENLKGIYIYNYVEILLMADKPETALKLFAEEDPKVSGYNPAYRDYLKAAAMLMINPNTYKVIKYDYVNQLAKNGKMKGWNYDYFNSWIKASGRSSKEKKLFYELEALNN